MSSNMMPCGSFVLGAFDCDADEEDELSFLEGDHILVVAHLTDDWFRGRVQKSGCEGLVPWNYVKKPDIPLHDPPPPPLSAPLQRERTYSSWRQSFQVPSSQISHILSRNESDPTAALPPPLPSASSHQHPDSPPVPALNTQDACDAFPSPPSSSDSLSIVVSQPPAHPVPLVPPASALALDVPSSPSLLIGSVSVSDSPRDESEVVVRRSSATSRRRTLRIVGSSPLKPTSSALPSASMHSSSRTPSSMSSSHSVNQFPTGSLGSEVTASASSSSSSSSSPSSSSSSVQFSSSTSPSSFPPPASTLSSPSTSIASSSSSPSLSQQSRARRFDPKYLMSPDDVWMASMDTNADVPSPPSTPSSFQDDVAVELVLSLRANSDPHVVRFGKWWVPSPSHVCREPPSPLPSPSPKYADIITSESFSRLLFDDSRCDEPLRDSLILSHTLFLNSIDFFDLIISKYDESVRTRDEDKRQRVCKVVQVWGDLFPRDFHHSSLHLMVNEFTKKLAPSPSPSPSPSSSSSFDLHFRSHFAQCESFNRSRVSLHHYILKTFHDAAAPPPPSPPPPPIHQFPPAVVAQHLTVLEWSVLAFLSSKDILSGEFTQSIEHFHRVTAWVSRAIAADQTTASFFLEVAMECANLFNFATPHAIFIAIDPLSKSIDLSLPPSLSDVLLSLRSLYSKEDSWRVGVYTKSLYRVVVGEAVTKAAVISSPMILSEERRDSDTQGISLDIREDGEGESVAAQKLWRCLDGYVRWVHTPTHSLPFRCYSADRTSPFSYILRDDVSRSLSPLFCASDSADVCDSHRLLISSPPFSLDSLSALPLSPAESIVSHDYYPLYFRDFHDTPSPPLCFVGTDSSNRPYIVTVRTYADPETLRTLGMAVVFTSASIGDRGMPVYHVIKGMDGDICDNEKKLAYMLTSSLPSLSPPPEKGKATLKCLPFTHHIDSQLLRLESLSIHPGPYCFGFLFFSGQSSSRSSLLSAVPSEQCVFFYRCFGSPAASSSSSVFASTDVPRDCLVTKCQDADVCVVVPWVCESEEEKKKAFEDLKVFVVFAEKGSEPFRPSEFGSGYVFIVVSPSDDGHYNVAVASRDHAASPSPPLPSGNSLPFNRAIQFILLKAVMSERYSHHQVASIFHQRDSHRLKIMKDLASQASQAQRKSRAATAIQGALDLNPMKCSSGGGGGGGGNALTQSSVDVSPVSLEEPQKVISIFRSCFLPKTSKNQKRRGKDVLQPFAALSAPLLSPSESFITFDTPPLSGNALNIVCRHLETSGTYKDASVNPYVSEVVEALPLLSDGSDASLEKIPRVPSRILFGALKLWFISKKWPLFPSTLYRSLLVLVVDDHISPNSTSKIHPLLQTLPAPNLCVLERLVRLCSLLSSGSVSKSSVFADHFACLLFAPPELQLDVLFKVRYQKLILQYLIDHHSLCFYGSETMTNVSPSLYHFSGPITFDLQSSAPKFRHTQSLDTKVKSEVKQKPPKKLKKITKTLNQMGLRKKDEEKSSHGEYAKVFALRDNSGKKVSIQEIVGAGTMAVLIFYVRDGSGVWRSLLKHLKANYDLLSVCGTQVFGVTNSDPTLLATDIQSLRLPFRLLSDGMMRTKQKFGVSSGKNASFVLNCCGEIIHSFDSTDGVGDHVLHIFYGLTLSMAGFYSFTSQRYPSPHFEYFYNLPKAIAPKSSDPLSVCDWRETEITQWLGACGLSDLTECFTSNEIKGADLLDLNLAELEDDLELKGHPLLPCLIAEINLIRVNNAKKRLSAK
jgi:peroxiredoxin